MYRLLTTMSNCQMRLLYGLELCERRAGRRVPHEDALVEPGRREPRAALRPRDCDNLVDVPIVIGSRV